MRDAPKKQRQPGPPTRKVRGGDAPTIRSAFNSGSWLIGDIITLEEESHERFLQADSAPGQGLIFIYRSTEALQVAFAIWSGLLHKKTRMRIDDSFVKFLDKLRNDYFDKKKITTKEYYGLKAEALELKKKYFLIKQSTNLNLPVEMSRHGTDYISEVTENP